MSARAFGEYSDTSIGATFINTISAELNGLGIKAEIMEYNIYVILDELKQEMLRCEDLTMRLVKARLNNDKEAEMKTLLDMSDQIVSNEQTFSFLISYLKELNENGNINE